MIHSGVVVRPHRGPHAAPVQRHGGLARGREHVAYKRERYDVARARREAGAPRELRQRRLAVVKRARPRRRHGRWVLPRPVRIVVAPAVEAVTDSVDDARRAEVDAHGRRHVRHREARNVGGADRDAVVDAVDQRQREVGRPDGDVVEARDVAHGERLERAHAFGLVRVRAARTDRKRDGREDRLVVAQQPRGGHLAGRLREALGAQGVHAGRHCDAHWHAVVEHGGHARGGVLQPRAGDALDGRPVAPARTEAVQAQRCRQLQTVAAPRQDLLGPRACAQVGARLERHLQPRSGIAVGRQPQLITVDVRHVVEAREGPVHPQAAAQRRGPRGHQVVSLAGQLVGNQLHPRDHLVHPVLAAHDGAPQVRRIHERRANPQQLFVEHARRRQLNVHSVTAAAAKHAREDVVGGVGHAAHGHVYRHNERLGLDVRVPQPQPVVARHEARGERRGDGPGEHDAAGRRFIELLPWRGDGRVGARVRDGAHGTKEEGAVQPAAGKGVAQRRDVCGHTEVRHDVVAAALRAPADHVVRHVALGVAEGRAGARVPKQRQVRGAGADVARDAVAVRDVAHHERARAVHDNIRGLRPRRREARAVVAAHKHDVARGVGHPRRRHGRRQSHVAAVKHPVAAVLKQRVRRHRVLVLEQPAPRRGGVVLAKPAHGEGEAVGVVEHGLARAVRERGVNVGHVAAVRARRVEHHQPREARVADDTVRVAAAHHDAHERAVSHGVGGVVQRDHLRLRPVCFDGCRVDGRGADARAAHVALRVERVHSREVARRVLDPAAVGLPRERRGGQHVEVGRAVVGERQQRRLQRHAAEVAGGLREIDRGQADGARRHDRHSARHGGARRAQAVAARDGHTHVLVGDVVAQRPPRQRLVEAAAGAVALGVVEARHEQLLNGCIDGARADVRLAAAHIGRTRHAVALSGAADAHVVVRAACKVVAHDGVEAPAVGVLDHVADVARVGGVALKVREARAVNAAATRLSGGTGRHERARKVLPPVDPGRVMGQLADVVPAAVHVDGSVEAEGRLVRVVAVRKGRHALHAALHLAWVAHVSVGKARRHALVVAALLAVLVVAPRARLAQAVVRGADAEAAAAVEDTLVVERAAEAG